MRKKLKRSGGFVVAMKLNLRDKIMTRMYDQATWKKMFERTMRAQMVWFTITMLALAVVGWIVGSSGALSLWWLIGEVLSILGIYFLGMMLNLRRHLRWWKHRVASSEDAAQEYAAMIEWETNAIGLESTTRVEFRRKKA